MKPPLPTEHDEQATVIAMWDRGVAHAFGLPHSLLFAIPNAGAGASRGQAGKMKAEGARAGTPDLMLAVARHDWHGLFVEMKRRDGGRISPDQVFAMQILAQQGYLCVVAKGADEAIAEIRKYLA